MPDAIANIDQAIKALTDARAQLADQAPAIMQLVGATAVPIPGGLVLAWDLPPGAERLSVFVSWGSQGKWIDKANLAPGTKGHTLTGLKAQPTEVDLGLLQPGVAAWPLVRLSAVPLATEAPSVPAEPSVPVDGQPGGSPDPSDYPADAATLVRRDWIAHHAGCKSADLEVVASQADLSRLGLPGLWVGNQWNLDRMPNAIIGGLDIHGKVYYTGAEPLAIADSKAWGIRYGSSAGKRGGLIQRCTLKGQPGAPLGEGVINFWGQQGWQVDSCDLSGTADGMQCTGPGVITDTWVHDLAYGYSPEQKGATHNDGVQNYGGKVSVKRSVFDMGGVPGSTNGALFCSTASASFVADDLFVETTRPDVNALHAWNSPEGIVVNGGRVIGGRLIGKVVLNNVER